MMIKHRKKAVSILLSAVMILAMWIPVSTVSAAGENDLTLTAELSTASVTTADAGQTVTLTLKKNQAVDLSAMGFIVDYDKDVLTLESITGNGGSLSIGKGDVNTENGQVIWMTESMDNLSVPEDSLAVVTFTLKKGDLFRSG